MDSNKGAGTSRCEDVSKFFMDRPQNMEVTKPRKEPFWVFGYGSLCWNPGFEYQQSVTGYVKGFSRRFWQGNTTHRGTEHKPGRVATLIEDQETCGSLIQINEHPQTIIIGFNLIRGDSKYNRKRKGITWGKAFLVAADDKAALPYLSTRECQLGGYRTYTVNFHARPTFHSSSSASDKKNAVLYIAVPENRHWLGAAPLPDIARQILECSGSSGSNAEYLLKLADFMREEIPEALDDHLFSLERLVRKFASDMKICLRSLMGEDENANVVEVSEEKEAKAVVPSYQFASRIPEKKLRCVNM